MSLIEPPNRGKVRHNRGRLRGPLGVGYPQDGWHGGRSGVLGATVRDGTDGSAEWNRLPSVGNANRKRCEAHGTIGH